MKITIKYKNGTIDQLDTESLTDSSGISNEKTSSIMTKYRINWREFAIGETPVNLNLYIYYYQKYNERGSSIKDRKYLDQLEFYENDQMVGQDWSQEQIAEKGKGLPYGLLEPGSWFTIVPYDIIEDILEISQDDTTMIINLEKYNELIDVSFLSYHETQYNLVDAENASYTNRILNLYDAITKRGEANNAQLNKHEISQTVGTTPEFLEKLILEYNNKVELEQLYR